MQMAGYRSPGYRLNWVLAQHRLAMERIRRIGALRGSIEDVKRVWRTQTPSG